MQEHAVQERAFLNSRSQLLKDTQWEYRVVAGGGWAGPSSPISRCCPCRGRAAGTEEGPRSPQERGKGMKGGGGTLGQGGSQGKGREVPWKPVGESVLSTAVRFRWSWGLLRMPPGPPSAPPSLRLLRRAEDIMDNTRESGAPR